MIAIDEDNTTILITRGDATQEKFNRLAFQFPIFNIETQQEELYEFQPDDKISFVAMEKKGYDKEEILRKEYTLREIGYIVPTTTPEIPLTAEDTKAFPLANKKKTYWYDLALNDETTILGSDHEGAKKIIVFPESEEE
jgi:hypothetical protein